MNLHNILLESVRKVLAEQTLEQKLNKEKAKGTKMYKGVSLAYLKSLETRFDPTYNRDTDEVGTYADWLVKHSLELQDYDAEQIRLGLEDFHNNKQILRNIGYPCDINPYTVEQISQLHFTMNAERNKKADAKNKKDMQAYEGQYEIEYESPHFFIVLAKTHEAERFFGQGTAWCTVGSSVFFNRYSDTGYHIVLPKNDSGYMWIVDAPEKYQFHVSDSLNFYCCDKKDRMVSLDEFPSELLDFIMKCKEEKKERVIGKCSRYYLSVVQFISSKLGVEPQTTPKTGNSVYMLDEENNIRLVIDKMTASIVLKFGSATKKIHSGIGQYMRDTQTFYNIPSDAAIQTETIGKIIESVIKVFTGLRRSFRFLSSYNRVPEEIMLLFGNRKTGENIYVRIDRYGNIIVGIDVHEGYGGRGYGSDIYCKVTDVSVDDLADVVNNIRNQSRYKSDFFGLSLNNKLNIFREHTVEVGREGILRYNFYSNSYNNYGFNDYVFGFTFNIRDAGVLMYMHTTAYSTDIFQRIVDIAVNTADKIASMQNVIDLSCRVTDSYQVYLHSSAEARRERTFEEYIRTWSSYKELIVGLFEQAFIENGIPDAEVRFSR